jgi:hypothetical protein
MYHSHLVKDTSVVGLEYQREGYPKYVVYSYEIQKQPLSYRYSQMDIDLQFCSISVDVTSSR